MTKGGQGERGYPTASSDALVLSVPLALPALCQRCGFSVSAAPPGCKNPCPNCGTIYPLGDCSD